MSNETVDSLGAKPVYRAVKTSRLYEQIVQQVEESILKGQLKPGDQLPAERQSARRVPSSGRVTPGPRAGDRGAGSVPH